MKERGRRERRSECGLGSGRWIDVLYSSNCCWLVVGLTFEWSGLSDRLLVMINCHSNPNKTHADHTISITYQKERMKGKEDTVSSPSVVSRLRDGSGIHNGIPCIVNNKPTSMDTCQHFSLGVLFLLLPNMTYN